jgi:hypothetical protein
MGLVRRVFLLWAVLFGAGLPAVAVEATLVADAHVNSALPGANSGAISNLKVGGGYTALLQFDLSTLPAGTTAAQVSRAILRLYCNRVDVAGQVSVQAVNQAWEESTVTYATLPSVGGGAQVVAVSQAGAYVTVDVTALVQGWMGASGTNDGLALTSGAAVVQFDSKENDLTGHAAALDVELVTAGPAGATGAAGPAGAQGPVGATGPAGPAGVPGASGAQGSPGLVYRGAYSASTTYGVGDVVLWQGSSYTSLLGSNLGHEPDLDPVLWGVLSSQGPAGATGAQGVTGLQGPVGQAGPAGSQGLAGPAGAMGLPGPAGPVGPQGALGPAGAAGAQGAAGLQGPVGQAGPAGPQGAQGEAGATGSQGPAGVAGPQGAVGPAGIRFRGAWAAGDAYLANDAVSFAGTTYLAVTSSSSSEPDLFPGVWAVLAQAGAAGPAGPTGPTGGAASVSVGMVTTGAAGTQAMVTNSGTASAAVLNFTIPQGAAGASGGGGSSGGGGISFASVYHDVSFSNLFFSVSSTTGSPTEIGSVLTWVPAGCTATDLNVFSQQSNQITVTLRQGTPGSMADTTMSCVVASGTACAATGSVVVPAGNFVDLSVSGASGAVAGVWMALTCH